MAILDSTTFPTMLGSIIGDIAGSCYEFNSPKRTDIDLFPAASEITDDSILTIATAEVLLTKGDYRRTYQMFGRLYPEPMGGYGARFNDWIWQKDPEPYQSWGNGAAMRVAPIGWAFTTVEDVLEEAQRSAIVSHDHPEGIKGAQATALTVFLARNRATKEEIREVIVDRFGYDLSRTVEEIRPSYRFDESCQGTVPQAIIAFLDSTDFESAVRLAISLGGDSDTLACITGGIAEAFYREMPESMVAQAMQKIPSGLIGAVVKFRERYPI